MRFPLYLLALLLPLVTFGATGPGGAGSGGGSSGTNTWRTATANVSLSILQGQQADFVVSMPGVTPLYHVLLTVLATNRANHTGMVWSAVASNDCVIVRASSLLGNPFITNVPVRIAASLSPSSGGSGSGLTEPQVQAMINTNNTNMVKLTDAVTGSGVRVLSNAPTMANVGVVNYIAVNAVDLDSAFTSFTTPYGSYLWGAAQGYASLYDLSNTRNVYIYNPTNQTFNLGSNHLTGVGTLETTGNATFGTGSGGTVTANLFASPTNTWQGTDFPLGTNTCIIFSATNILLDDFAQLPTTSEMTGTLIIVATAGITVTNPISWGLIAGGTNKVVSQTVESGARLVMSGQMLRGLCTNFASLKFTP